MANELVYDILKIDDFNRPKLSEHECFRLLWIKVILRAAYDWVLYRDSKNLIYKKEAKRAYTWLFESPKLKKKVKIGKTTEVVYVDIFNSLENICGCLDLDIEVVRKFAKNLTRDDVRKMEFLERNSKKKRLLLKESEKKEDSK